MVKEMQIKIVFCFLLIPLYYIVGDRSIFLYVLSLTLYNIFSAFFKNISIKDTLSDLNEYSKYKLFKLSSLVICVISLIFLLFGILISDLALGLLKINNSFLPFLFMGISIMADPLIKNCLEYLESFKFEKFSKCLHYVYWYLQAGLFLLIALFGFRIFDFSEEVISACLFLPKIISAIIVNILVYFIVLKNKHNAIISKRNDNSINYKEEIRIIFNKNNFSKVVNIIKNIYYYFSIIILYLVLSRKYSYMLDDIIKIISFVYFYVLSFIDLLVEFIVNKNSSKKKVLNKIYYTFDDFLMLSIVLCVIAPLICKIVFYDSEVAIYLIMGLFLGIFIALYNITFKYISNIKLGYVSLFLGIFAKFILMVPLVDSFYRMGYNLICGDIISTIIGMSISTVVNYIYFKNREKEEKYFEKLLKCMYENLFLCIFLVVIQFIIPINNDYGYFKSVLLILFYGVVSVMFIKYRRKKRV